MTENEKHPIQDHSFSKEERLCRKYYIDSLFDKGKVIKKYPLRMVWTEGNASEEMPVQVILGVSKRLFKKAYQRIRIKRVLREVYRKHKAPLYDDLLQKNRKLSLAIFYIAKDPIDYHKVEADMVALLDKLRDRL